MADYPVRVELLSRFRTRRAQQQVVKELAAGSVDIVIGTHRLLQGDIAFKDLGLVVIDEEQRFGVMHKEKFKMLRKLVDVLTLSATPIPRTLYLALTGARDMRQWTSPSLPLRVTSMTLSPRSNFLPTPTASDSAPCFPAQTSLVHQFVQATIIGSSGVTHRSALLALRQRQLIRGAQSEFPIQ